MFARIFGLKKSVKTEKEKSLAIQVLPRDFAPKGLLLVPPNCEIVKLDNPPLKKSSHLHVKQDLFTKPVLYHDVKQNTGDWSLYASLQAIAALPTGNETIMGMMKDIGNTVIVRMFDEQARPHYIAIEKSVPGGTRLTHGELWVKMLEKAYLVWSGKNPNMLKAEKVATIIRMFTGAKHFDVSSSLPLQQRQRLFELKDYSNALGIMLFHALMTLNNQSNEKIKEVILKTIFINQPELLEKWEKWLLKNNDTWQMFWSTTHPINFDHVQRFFLEHNLPESQDAFSQVTSWLNQEKILSGPQLSGRYSYEELNFFKIIKQQILHNSPIVVETGNSPQFGLIPNHCYAVIGYHDDHPSNRKLVFVCNPYSGDFFNRMFIPSGRRSKLIPIKQAGAGWKIEVTTTNKSVSCMELSDFTNSFKNFIHMESVSPDAILSRTHRN